MAYLPLYFVLDALSLALRISFYHPSFFNSPKRGCANKMKGVLK